MLDAVYWKDAAAVYRLWRSGKKRLVEMTDGDLQKYDDYLHLILVEREFRSLELVLATRKRFPRLRLFAIVPAAIVFLLVVYPLIRGLF